MSKPTIIDRRGENPNKISAIDYRKMCQIHETVFINQLLRICQPVPPVPPVPIVPRKWWHEVLLGPSLPHAPGVRMMGVKQTPSNDGNAEALVFLANVLRE